MYKLSKTSLKRLEGVDEKLVNVVKQAIEITTIDFGVIEGLRSLRRQKQLYANGATQTLNSKHIEGKAVDLVAYLGSRISWELNLYDNIADAIRIAAIENQVPIRWGAAWHIDDIRYWDKSMELAMMSYVDLRRSQGRRPFIDAVHFEIN